ncbi:MAG: DNA cytosine methyltransferase [Myxococcota bacterium]
MSQLELLPKKSRTRKGFDDAAWQPTGPVRRVAGLFAGVGGLELGLSRAGHETALLCELEPGAQEVLKARFPELPVHGDVRSLEHLPDDVDLLVGGFPCQDLSQAGQTRGITGAQSGLIGEVFRLLKERPLPWMVLENVPFMLQLGRGEALEVIVSMLEHFGYRWAYRVVDSRAFGLPQRRRRVLIVASLAGDPRDVLLSDDAGAPDPPDRSTWRERACGFYWTEGVRGLGWADDAVPTLKGGSTVGIPSPPAVVLPDGRVVTPDVRDAERLQGFDADWTSPSEAAKRAGHRWKLVGNAVTVDVAEWLGMRLRTPGAYDATGDARLRRKRSWPTCAYNVDGCRMQAPVSEWPARRPSPPLATFLQFEPAMLSPRATAGFLTRAGRGNLNFPDGFIETLERHLSEVSTHGEAA